MYRTTRTLRQLRVMPYWTGSGLGLPPGDLVAFYLFTDRAVRRAPPAAGFDPHLRSTEEVIGYRVHAADGRVGRVNDFTVDDADWLIRRINVRAGSWPRRRKTALSPLWVTRVSWRDQALTVSLSRSQVLSAPEWNASLRNMRDYDACLLDSRALPVGGPWIRSAVTKNGQTPGAAGQAQDGEHQ